MIFILAVYVVKQLFGNEVKEEIPTLASGSDSEEFKLLYISVLSNQTDKCLRLRRYYRSKSDEKRERQRQEIP